MIDKLSLLLTHGVLLLAFWRLAKRDDLNSDTPKITRHAHRPWHQDTSR